MTRELCLLTVVADVDVVGAVVVLMLERPEAGGSGRPLLLLSPTTDITEDLEDLNCGEAGSLGLTSLFSDSEKGELT